MRIIGGEYKGKKLLQPLDKTTRPLKDIVKESIFNIIEHSKKIKTKLENSKILDLYAGSGSFGIECISRNAKSVCFIEKYMDAIKILNKNISSLKKNSNYQIYNEDCINFISSEKFCEKNFDIIFLDPPFKETRVNEVLSLIIKNDKLISDGTLIVHKHVKDKIEFLDNFKIIEDRKYGISRIFFIKKV